MTQYVFHTNCVTSTAESITEMVDLEREITAKQFLYGPAKSTEILDDVLHRLGYQEWGDDCGRSPRVLFEDDFAVSCHHSWYLGFPCLYVRHSRIEYVYVNSNQVDAITSMEDCESERQERAQILEREWASLKNHADTLGVSTRRAAERFSNHHYGDLLYWRIPLQTIIQAGDNQKLARFLRKWDKKALL